MSATDLVVYVILRRTEKNAADASFRRVLVAEIRLLAKEVGDLAKLAVKRSGAADRFLTHRESMRSISRPLGAREER